MNDDAPGVACTTVVMSLVAVFLVAYDIFAVQRWGVPASISAVLFDISCRHPMVPFTLGFIWGHIFWPIWRGGK